MPHNFLCIVTDLQGRVLVCDATDQILQKILKDNGLSVSYMPEITRDELAEKIKDYEIIIVRSRTKLTADLIKNATSCKIIARVGVGLDNIDLNAAKEANIRVINAIEGAMMLHELAFLIKCCKFCTASNYDDLISFDFSMPIQVPS